MNAPPERRQTTYRLTPELDKRITEEAEKLGISKNAFVQITLTNALEKESLTPTGTDS